MLSIVLSCYNDAERLNNSIYGYTRQTNDNFQLIVVNDGGEDLHHVVLQYPSLNITYKYVDPKTEQFRLAKARNHGLHSVEGRRVLFSDGDCIPDKTLVEVHSRYTDESYIVAGRRKHIPSPLLREIDLDNPHLYSVEDDGRLKPPHTEMAGAIRQGKMQYYSQNHQEAFGHNVSYNTDIITSVGGFWEEMVGWGGEDMELNLRLKRVGIRCLFDMTAVVYHMDHIAHSTHSDAKMRIRQMLDISAKMDVKR